jgi:DNA-binding NarL/FixJ family response regulator
LGELLADADAPVELLIVDLTDRDLDGAGAVRSLADADALGTTRTLGFYSHVEPAVRERAEQAGFDLVVPRSRMAREGAELVAGLL